MKEVYSPTLRFQTFINFVSFCLFLVFLSDLDQGLHYYLFRALNLLLDLGELIVAKRMEYVMLLVMYGVIFIEALRKWITVKGLVRLPATTLYAT